MRNAMFPLICFSKCKMSRLSELASRDASTSTCDSASSRSASARAPPPAPKHRWCREAAWVAADSSSRPVSRGKGRKGLRGPTHSSRPAARDGCGLRLWSLKRGRIPDVHVETPTAGAHFLPFMACDFIIPTTRLMTRVRAAFCGALGREFRIAVFGAHDPPPATQRRP